MLAMRLVLGGAAGVAAIVMTAAMVDVAIAQGGSIYQATLAEPHQKTEEVSTEEVRRILADGSAIILDSRKRSEFVAGHIAGARNVAPIPGAPPSEYAAAVERLIGGDKTKALVLYCNGQFCQASRRLSEQLVAAGFTNVRRYQLGIPIWRALGGPVEIELEGIVRIFKVDQTAVFFDARTVEEFSKGTLPGHTTSRSTNSHRMGWSKPRCQETISIRALCCSDAMPRRHADSPMQSARPHTKMSLIFPAHSTHWRRRSRPGRDRAFLSAWSCIAACQ